jgi:hypothetical protein
MPARRIHVRVRSPMRRKKRGTHDVRVVKALEDPHLAEHALLIALDLLLRYGLQGDIESDEL